MRPIHTGAPMSKDSLALTLGFKEYLIKQDLSDRTSFVVEYAENLYYCIGTEKLRNSGE